MAAQAKNCVLVQDFQKQFNKAFSIWSPPLFSEISSLKLIMSTSHLTVDSRLILRALPKVKPESIDIQLLL